MKDPDFRPISDKVLGQGIHLTLEELRYRSPSGTEVVRDVVRHPGGVAVLAVDGDKIWLIRQHRAPFGQPLDEIPAGKLDPNDVDAETAARRELEEELGATARSWRHLATMAPSPGYTDEVIEIFAAQGLEFGDRRPDGAEEAEARVFALPIGEALDSIDRGDLIDAKTQVALLQWTRRPG